MISTVERRYLIHGLKTLFKSVRKGTYIREYKDNFWKISIKRSVKK